jgi:8-oxo-dGTP diphosphatase
LAAIAREYPACPLVGVGAVVFRERHVLLIRRRLPPRVGEWSLPGGLQELGETVADAARREVLEETGVAARIRGVVDVVDLIQRDPLDDRVRTHYTLIDMLGVWEAGEPVAASDATDAAWIPISGIARLGLWSETERVIRLAVRHLADDDRC